MALPFFLLTELSGVVTFFQEHDDWAAHAVQLLGGAAPHNMNYLPTRWP